MVTQSGIVLTKANIAFLKQKQQEERDRAKTPAWGGMRSKSEKPKTKISHAARKARRVAASYASDPKNKK